MTTAIAKTERITTIRDLLNKSKEQIKLALPKHLTPDRMLRVAMTTIQTNPKLLECDPRSLVAAVIEASQLGLELDGVLGHAYLIPYNTKYGKKAQLQIGYRGFIELARRSGQVSTIFAHVVHENDEWDFQLGLDPKLYHKPTREDPGEIIAAYAVVKMKDGSTDFEWMWKRQIDAVRKRSKAADDGPWVTDYEEMAKKTVIRRLAKRLPLSIEFQRAAVADEYIEAGVLNSLTDEGSGGFDTPPSGRIAEFDERFGGDPAIEEFVAKTAEANNVTIEEVKAQAVEYEADFRKAYEDWRRRQNLRPVEPKPPQEEGSSPTDPQQPETKKETNGNEDPFRKEYIHLRANGFSTWVFKNLDRIKQASEADQKEIQAKWEKLYPQVAYPLAENRPRKEEGEPQGSPPAPANAENPPQMVSCPEWDGKERPAADCDACKMREGCPEWEEQPPTGLFDGQQ